MKQLVIGLLASIVAASCMAAETWKPRFALQLYSFRDRSFVEAVQTAKKVGFEYVEAYPGQRLGEGFEGGIGTGMNAETRQKVKDFLKAQGLKMIVFGVCGAGDENGWKDLFSFAKDMGIEILQVEVGKDDKTMDLLDKLAAEYGVKVALHNHAQKEGFPEAQLQQLGNRKNVGSGTDTGHWVTAGLNPLEGVKKLEGRFFTLHLVDKDKMGGGNRDVPYGKGVGEIAKILDELRRQKFSGPITCEYEHQSATLEDEVAECVKWYNNYLK
ncbi:MAG: sugar phosphate isomerase/epimerase [Kiritimatiellaeota bacterium]|nr:sugar phosphate isomerase/epimerase [Kiritimatiellota bacterium]